MITTRRNNQVGDYLGIDLTDWYSNSRRNIDVCGLSLKKTQLSACFWLWQWPEPNENLKLGLIADEVRSAKSSMIDGPQALADLGNPMRECERLSGAAGKTPDILPELGRPFAGYIRSSIKIFSAFHQTQIQISPPNFIGGVSEIYPGYIWCMLGNRTLPNKSSVAGRQARKHILQALGVIDLPDLPTHDQNDACIGAVLAAAANGCVHGLTVRGLGNPLEIDINGALREGPMVIPVISEGLQQIINTAISNSPAPMLTTIARTSHQSESNEKTEQKARNLRDNLINHAQEGNAQICTYKYAYNYIFDSPNSRWSQAYAKKVVSIAKNTTPAELFGLGTVRLDTFIVSSKTKRPSDGHWESADYDREDWERVLGTATVLE